MNGCENARFDVDHSAYSEVGLARTHISSFWTTLRYSGYEQNFVTVSVAGSLQNHSTTNLRVDLRNSFTLPLASPHKKHLLNLLLLSYMTAPVTSQVEFQDVFDVEMEHFEIEINLYAGNRPAPWCEMKPSGQSWRVMARGGTMRV